MAGSSLRLIFVIRGLCYETRWFDLLNSTWCYNSPTVNRRLYNRSPYSLFVIHFSFFIIHYSLFVIRYSLLVIASNSPPRNLSSHICQNMMPPSLFSAAYFVFKAIDFSSSYVATNLLLILMANGA